MGERDAGKTLLVDIGGHTELGLRFLVPGAHCFIVDALANPVTESSTGPCRSIVFMRKSFGTSLGVRPIQCDVPPARRS